MNYLNRLPAIVAILLFFVMVPFAEADAQADSATGVGSPEFKISGSRSFWMGSNYRKEWKTPIKVPVLNLATEKGGLTPTKRGGGKQTKSLRLEDKDGREYALRSIQKFITNKTLPPDLQSEAAEDIVADGVSASYPYAALSIPPLADAAGIPYGKVKLVYVPDDPKLGEHRADFANILALFEERLPASVKKGFDTDEVADKLKDDNDNDVDQQALLKARILDMFVMDFDRHEDQWQWGAIDKDKGKTYFPIPRDRDQPFYINRGLMPGIVKWPWIVPQLQGFDDQAKNINRFNFAARNFDRFFLNGLSEQDWQQAVDKFVSQMTDEVIENAINQQPPEIRHISGDDIVKNLKARRQYLPAEVMQYYRFLAEIVSVTGSDKHELFEITNNSDGSVTVQVFKITKEGEQSTKIYDRTFSPAVTKELRLYGFGGDDKFVVKGSNSNIRVRMIGGEGEDVFENTSSYKGGIVYDAESEKNSVTGDFRNKISGDTAVNSFERIYYKYNQVIPFISVNYNRDDGLFLGASLKIIRHGFRKDPYKTFHEFAVSHALATKAFNFRYYSEYIGVFGKTGDLLFDADIKAPNNTTNFFGYGGASVYDKNQPGQYRYYRARYNLGDISMLLRKRFSPKVTMSLGPTYQFFDLDPNDKNNMNRYIVMTGMNGLDPNTLFEKQSYFGGKFMLTADTRNNPALPSRGVFWNSSLRYLSGLNDASYNVTQLNSEFTFYLQLSPKTLVLVNRFGGGHNFGDFEFYQAQYLGSEDNLRGYRKYRFAGRSKLFNNTELRIRLASFRTYLFPGSLGILGFYDTGRVWDDNNSSSKWLSGYGGGFWFSPLNRLVISISYMASKEDKLPLIGFGWKFD